jgi:uncharacterized protein YegP (UPF0339 family)
MKRPRFEIRDAADGQVYVVLIAGNGEPLMTSETFPDVSTAGDNITAVRRAAIVAGKPVRRRKG